MAVNRSVVVKSLNQVNKPWVYSLEESVAQLFHFSTTSFHLSNFTIAQNLSPRNILYCSSSRLVLKESRGNWLLISKHKANEIRLLPFKKRFALRRSSKICLLLDLHDV